MRENFEIEMEHWLRDYFGCSFGSSLQIGFVQLSKYKFEKPLSNIIYIYLIIYLIVDRYIYIFAQLSLHLRVKSCRNIAFENQKLVDSDQNIW